MLIQHFVSCLSDRISGEVRMHEPKTLEVDIEKAWIEKVNLSLASSGATGRQTISALVSRSVVRGVQLQVYRFARSNPPPSKGERH